MFIKAASITLPSLTAVLRIDIDTHRQNLFMGHLLGSEREAPNVSAKL